MSGLHAQPKEYTRQIIADLDDLFTEHGIAVSGDGATLKRWRVGREGGSFDPDTRLSRHNRKRLVMIIFGTPGKSLLQ
ncbi:MULTISPECIES: hypothetical protein [unclassified Pseudomonas]|uniref:hypothetical protein n=1 Tax=unclassified Pseudomonas TaxID=196821 RepID=UPI002A35CEA9|nr:hypothetical protein [Pseudomonas sp. P9_31]WPN60842.1 hypothetical protein QMK51_24160 [Pseudomonas sp. P9_31]